jgi:3' exoribonuclease, RNase T-like
MADEENKLLGGITLPKAVVVEEDLTSFTPSPTRPDLALMLDIESLDLGPRSVITQIALFALDLEEDETIDTHLHSYLPIQPQLDLMPARTISASTLWWWMQQPDEARAAFEFSTSEDFNDLPVLMQHFIVQFERMTRGRTYQLWARGPQFDVVNVESLLRDCGLKAPWRHDSVADLRTVMREAGISSSDVEQPHGFIAHNAAWDCKFQLLCLREAQRKIRGRK